METLVNDLEIFVITNGRSTLELTMKAIRKQSVQVPVTVIRNMKWVDALNRCVDLAQCKCFLRVDDDMFMHTYAVAYYLHKLPKFMGRKWGAYVCRLWEDWSNKPVNGLRMYKTSVVKRLGFKSSRLGKVDKVFNLRLQKIGLKQKKDLSMVGIHVLASESDQKRYRKLWREKNAHISSEAFSKTFDNLIHPQKKSVKQQYRILSRIPKLNYAQKTNYGEFLKK